MTDPRLPSSTTKHNWFERHPKSTKFFLFVVVLLMLEGLTRILNGFGLVPYQRYPTTSQPVFWDDINPSFGTWHYPNASFRNRSSCFDVVLTSNAVGACDRERSLQSNASARYVVLGDSFVEGYGVDMEERFTNLLEDQTGFEFLNFGTSGSFGTIQEWLLYRDLASQYEHTAVMLFILPANDFSDNNPKDFPSTRYRPYLREKNDSFELYYPVAFEDRQRIFRDWGLIIKNTIDNTSYLANYLRYANRTIKSSFKDAEPSQTRTATYTAYSDNDLAKMLFCLRKIAALAGKRPCYIFTIPGEDDFNLAREQGYGFRLVDDLKEFAAQSDAVHYSDLLPAFLEHASENGYEYQRYTHTCDAHWNQLGHAVAAKSISQTLTNRRNESH